MNMNELFNFQPDEEQEEFDHFTDEEEFEVLNKLLYFYIYIYIYIFFCFSVHCVVLIHVSYCINHI